MALQWDSTHTNNIGKLTHKKKIHHARNFTKEMHRLQRY